jgi:Fe2+ or Zn2+ uptake regulation protein
VLVQDGAVVRIEMPGAQARFDADTHRHYHVRCKDCGRVDDVPGEALEALLMPRVQRPDYEITGVRVEFEGRCASCRAAA